MRMKRVHARHSGSVARPHGAGKIFRALLLHFEIGSIRERFDERGAGRFSGHDDTSLSRVQARQSAITGRVFVRRTVSDEDLRWEHPFPRTGRVLNALAAG
jgi:hypothetical protein